ncbi:S8 family serine peptidase [Roseibacterium sp. SDUM158017]|uniref:S8 family serine peptidase n=1 Tax=Roseicyclus salinarum TaxID=3036773 RepID=UPI002414F9DE|nr:S8 family serine peptidase [Roseibacterium sp. SDUM158017]MDG4647366.1 S8 family serine peptidase [Roseibacterium sp. SDUM158017]
MSAFRMIGLAAALAALVGLAGSPAAAQTGAAPAPGAGPGAGAGPGGTPGGGSRGTTRDEGDPGRRDAAAMARDEVARFEGRPEFVLHGTPASVAAGNAALVGAGATLLRIRPLPGLSREMRVYDLGRRLEPATARTLLGAEAPGAAFDANAIYRYAQAAPPRVYAASAIGAEAACRLPPSVTLGIVDGPVAAGHPALRGADLTAVSALLPGDVPVDADHGTAVAALIAGEDPSGGLGGFAPGLRVVAVGAFAREGRSPGADVDRIAGALDALARTRADVINMSFAGPANRVLSSLVEDVAATGAVMVAAAGNRRDADIRHPAGLPQVIAVTAVDAGLRRFRSAGTGTHIEFAAPGVDLYVADAAGGRYASGTSFAAPIVAAMAARLVAEGTRSTEAIRAALRASSRDLGVPGRDTETGWGLPRAPDC